MLTSPDYPITPGSLSGRFTQRTGAPGLAGGPPARHGDLMKKPNASSLTPPCQKRARPLLGCNGLSFPVFSMVSDDNCMIHRGGPAKPPKLFPPNATRLQVGYLRVTHEAESTEEPGPSGQDGDPVGYNRLNCMTVSNNRPPAFLS